AGPLVWPVPALGRRPGLIATVVLPARDRSVAPVLLGAEQLAEQPLVVEQEAVLAQPELHHPAADVRHQRRPRHPVAQLQRPPAVILRHRPVAPPGRRTAACRHRRSLAPSVPPAPRGILLRARRDGTRAVTVRRPGRTLWSPRGSR